jgi:hypothetical protein
MLPDWRHAQIACALFLRNVAIAATAGSFAVCLDGFIAPARCG